LRAVSTAVRCGDYSAVELYLNEGGNPDGFYGMTLLGTSFYIFSKLYVCYISVALSCNRLFAVIAMRIIL